MRTLRDTTERDLESIRQALTLLRLARTLQKAARSMRSADYVAGAIKSTDGALRHAVRATPPTLRH